MHRDGSGTVTVTAVLDADAVKAVEAGGGKLEDRVRLTDLAAAGWTSTWTRAADGSAQLELRKHFASVDEVAGIMREISGTTGPLRDVTVTREQGLVSTHYSVHGSLDLEHLGDGVTSDPDVVAALTNQKVDIGALDQSLASQIHDSLHVTVEIQLPGRRAKVVGTAGKTTPIHASTSVLDTRRIVLVLVGLALVVAALVVWRGPWARRRRTS